MAANQRRRLTRAMAQLVQERGYAATTGADLIELAGVSRKTLYTLFGSREGLLSAAFEECARSMLDDARAAAARARGSASRLQALAKSLCADGYATPGAISLCTHDIVAAGPHGLDLRERLMCDYGDLLRGADVAGDSRPDAPAAILAGALHRTIESSLLDGEDDPAHIGAELARWARCYDPIPDALQSAGRLPRRWPYAGSTAGLLGGRAPGTLSLATAQLPPLKRPSRQFLAHARRERIIDAVAQINAEQGYAALNPRAIVRRAELPPRTFSENFADVQDAFAVALDVGHAKGQSIVEKARAASGDWADGVRDALHALLEFFAAEPQFTQLAFVDAPLLGREMARRTHEHARAYGRLLFEGQPKRHKAPASAAELTAQALFEMFFCHAARGRAAKLAEASATATYIALAPFLGAEHAAAVAAA